MLTDIMDKVLRSLSSVHEVLAVVIVWVGTLCSLK